MMAQMLPYLTYSEFIFLAQTSIQRFSANWLNNQQDQAVFANPYPPLFIVAGPGTGKTTVLSLRVLKLILVDGFYPDTIIATTFTRKAAKELRSRILGWGTVIHSQALIDAKRVQNFARLTWLEKIDINTIRTGTLDSIAQEMVEDDRLPGEISPTVIETFLATGILRREIILDKNWQNDLILEAHLSNFNSAFPGVKGFTEKTKAIRSFAERTIHDDVELLRYGQTSIGHKKLQTIVETYHAYLRNNSLLDFSLLELSILERLKNSRLISTTQSVRALLVDEFQDTNFLQEQIYYEMIQKTNASFTVVGDDDQSIFRFRGATVEIFKDFENRCSNALGLQGGPLRIDLVENYRSSERIVRFFNHFISIEKDYQASRVPNKRPIIAKGTFASMPDFPILGMFRENMEHLSADICEFLGDIFIKSGKTIPVSGGQNIIVQRGIGGNFGDSVLLSSSVDELKDSKPRLPLLIRQKLKNAYGIDVFNPRGRKLAEIEDVAQLLGLMLECIDPNSRIQSSIVTFKQNIRQVFDDWRNKAQQFIATNPNPPNLRLFVNNWGSRISSNGSWPREWPLLELMFTLVAWFPSLQRYPEGQVYLEAIARAIAEAGQISSYSSMILHGTMKDDQSVKEALREVFEAIADDSIEVDEEIMPYVPRSHFPIMTIHQAKGLEFPFVIIDVGSYFTSDHPAQRKFRYPYVSDNVHATEDHISQFSVVGPDRIKRSGIQRAFDDLRRLYYVATSRPHCILLLVGLTTLLSQKVVSIAMGDLYLPVLQRKIGNKKAPIPRMFQFINANDWYPNCPDDTVAKI